MENQKVIVLAELPVKAEHIDNVKAIAAATLQPTLAEPGCEAFYQTAKQDDECKLVLFEVFSSKEAFDEHMQANYTKEFFAQLEGKLSAKPSVTYLQQL
jgi:quinol monooxygenase YgiN